MWGVCREYFRDPLPHPPLSASKLNLNINSTSLVLQPTSPNSMLQSTDQQPPSRTAKHLEKNVGVWVDGLFTVEFRGVHNLGVPSCGLP